MTTRKAPPAAESTKRARADAALEEPNKRARAEAAPQLSQETSTSPVPIKRARVDAALDAQIEEHRCPITLELMVDPVAAPDGRLYEREAITRWLDTTNRVVVGRSPATNEMMVGEIIPIHPVRSAIEALVKGGCVEPADEAPWQMRRGRLLEARGDRAGAATCFERARALGHEDDALLLLREAAAACPDAKRALAEAGEVWRTAGGRLSWGPESRRYDPRRLDVVVSGERDVDVDAGWRLDARASTKSALVWRREGETVWWVRARRQQA